MKSKLTSLLVALLAGYAYAETPCPFDVVGVVSENGI